MITVLLVDDHAVVREGYRRLLERHEITVVGEAADAASAQELFARLAPQVVVMDITLPGVSGIEAMRRLLCLDGTSRVLIFSMHEDAIFARRALQAGAYGYVTKASAPHVLVAAVQSIAAGKKYLSPEVAQEIALTQAAPDRTLEGLSAQEFEVLRMLVRGHAIKDIAPALGLKPKTVANLQSTIKQKLGAATAVQLLQAAAKLGLGPSD